MEESDKTPTEIAVQLCLKRNQLYKLKDKMVKTGESPTSTQGRPEKDDQSESTKLRAENKRLKEKNEILKKAAISFAKELD
jgi:transposase